MHTVLLYAGIAIAATYFIAFGVALLMGLFDRQKDSTTDNKVVVFLMIIVILVVPLFGMVSYLAH